MPRETNKTGSGHRSKASNSDQGQHSTGSAQSRIEPLHAAISMSDTPTETGNPGAAADEPASGSGSIASLEARIDELIKVCDDLSAANGALREQQAHLMAERASLIEKSELARSRVEAMIARLKAMEINV